jgi:hypothetical protein
MAEFNRISFLDKLNSELANAIGPLAPALVKEKLDQLGKEKSNFPKGMAARLVELLSQEIGDEEREVQFQSALLDTLINL